MGRVLGENIFKTLNPASCLTPNKFIWFPFLIWGCAFGNYAQEVPVFVKNVVEVDLFDFTSIL